MNMKFPARYGMTFSSNLLIQGAKARKMMQRELHNTHKQGFFPLMYDEYVHKGDVVRNLYNFAYDTADNYDPNDGVVHLFLLELLHTDSNAYECCCADIAAFLVGG